MNYLKAMRDALEALERGPWTMDTKEKYNKAITQLRAAIEAWEKEEPVVELVDWPNDSVARDWVGDTNYPIGTKLYLRKDEE